MIFGAKIKQNIGLCKFFIYKIQFLTFINEFHFEFLILINGNNTKNANVLT